jgi:hypothetical protein
VTSCYHTVMCELAHGMLTVSKCKYTDPQHIVTVNLQQKLVNDLGEGVACAGTPVVYLLDSLCVRVAAM